MIAIRHSCAGIRHSGEGRNPVGKICLLAFILCASCAGVTNAAELGRLFFTPQERAKLETQGAKADAPVQRDTLTVNGMIQKSGGKRIFWINGEQQDAVASPEKAPASVKVTVPGNSRPVEVKVGQRIELNPQSSAPQE